MNAVEQVVEAYFRLCKKCFTMADVKVAGGNNRQFDLLAYSPKDGSSYHVEPSVTHEVRWCPNSMEMVSQFDRKFLGVPPKRDGENTDHARGKHYLEQINATYVSFGLDPQKIQRVYCCWDCGEPHLLAQTLAEYHVRTGLKIEYLSFRETVLPEVLIAVGMVSANYDEPVLRALSLVMEFFRQKRLGADEGSIPVSTNP